jgi:hypothetical protein
MSAIGTVALLVRRLSMSFARVVCFFLSLLSQISNYASVLG